MSKHQLCAALPLGLALCGAAAPLAAQPIAAPSWKVGDRWAYALTVGPADTCTKNLATGTLATFEVTSADPAGYETRRDANGNVQTQKWAPDLTSVSSRGFSKLKLDGFGFGAAPDASWESGWFSGPHVKTELRCTRGALEKIAVPAGEFEAVPVVCSGSWENSMNPNWKVSGPATAKYWYAPAERNHVKLTLTTLLPNGGGCVDTEWSLTRPKG